MNRTSFTAMVPVDTKLAIIKKIPLYINQKCKIEFCHLQFSDTFNIYVLDEDGTFMAEILFSDKGAKIVSKAAKLKIDTYGLTYLWRDELSENYGAEYMEYLNKITHKTDYTI